MNTLTRSTGTDPLRMHSIRFVATRLAAWAVNALKTWAERSRTRKQLAELDDAMLRDICVSRTSANFEADKAFWQP